MDVEKCKVVAALDKHTCPICGKLDGTIIKMSDYEVGSTAPPFHPWCRCTTAPYFEDMEGIGERYARDVETGESFTVPKDMTYEQWKAIQDKKYGAGKVDTERKKVYNEVADKKQFEAYKKRLSDEVPKTFKDFQEFKYTNPEAYKDLTEHYRYKGRVPEATKEDFETYKAIKAIGIRGSIRVPALPSQHAYILEDKSSKRDPAHIMHRMFERNISADNVQNYIDNALFSVKQYKGTRRVFYSKEGVTVLTYTQDYDGIDWIAKTTWSKYDFEETVEKAIQEAIKHGK
ncbi:MAG: phage head morphogenesis protein [Clostridiales bacterium]|nr:phage head morphogenesis protein [Clostridiales bacterium]